VREPVRVRYAIPLTAIPPVAGLSVGIPLWNQKAEIAFFSSALEVLALGAVAMALTGNFFRLSLHRTNGTAGFYAIFNVVFVLVTTGLGMGFSFGALADGESTTGDVAFTAAALAAGVAAFAIQALFGTPGLRDEQPGRPV
jgi:hypothetical protein